MSYLSSRSGVISVEVVCFENGNSAVNISKDNRPYTTLKMDHHVDITQGLRLVADHLTVLAVAARLDE